MGLQMTFGVFQGLQADPDPSRGFTFTFHGSEFSRELSVQDANRGLHPHFGEQVLRGAVRFRKKPDEKRLERFKFKELKVFVDTIFSHFV